MEKVIYILLLFLGYTAYSQSLSIFNVDTSAFPILKANFFAIDQNNELLTNLSNTDFEVYENGVQRTVTNVICPSPKTLIALSSVLVMDVSESMRTSRLEIEKAAANVWIDIVSLGKSECAITSFNNHNYLNQDFTTDKTKLINAIYNLYSHNGTNFNAALIDSMAGGILVAKTGKNKRVIIFLTDGIPEDSTKIDKVIREANLNNVAIYCVTIDMKAPQFMHDFSDKTGGLCFENISTKTEAEECYRKILMNAQGIDPCTIEWRSGISCDARMANVELNMISNNLTANTSYQPPKTSIGQLEFNPVSLQISNAIPGIIKDEILNIKAVNSDFRITNITSSNPAFTITPISFYVKSGQSRNLTISYLPKDSGFVFSKFTFDNDLCQIYYYVSGGFPGKRPKSKTLKIIQPNGGEVFEVGDNTDITWDGMLPKEKVLIEYSIDNGINWTLVKDTAKGLIYKWRVLKTPSNRCLARVTANPAEMYICNDGEVQIYNQIWMCSNLDVVTYRNGDTIPEVKDSKEWTNTKSGAWCYYNNDPAMGAIYGKLYNWKAVIDLRGLAPEGWHIAADSDWIELEHNLGGANVAGGKLKLNGTRENGNGLWYAPNTDATNESGFTALPAGIRLYDGTFLNVGYDTYWWLIDIPPYTSWYRRVNDYNGLIEKGSYMGENGFSVRCVKD